MKVNYAKLGRRASLCLGIITLLALTAGLSSCGSDSSSRHTPKFLVGVDSVSGQNFEVLPIDAKTGALGTAVSYDLGVDLANPYAVATHPKNGNWVYVCDWDYSPYAKVVAVSLDSDGKPTVLNTADTSTVDGCDWAFSMTITPNGKYLFTADYDGNNVSMFAIESDGKLKSLGAFDSGISAVVITSTNSYVYVNDESEQISALKINSGGTLSCVVSGCVVQTVSGGEFSSMAADRNGKFLYATNDSQLYGYKIKADGSLEPLSSSPFDLKNGGWSAQMSFATDNKFIYVADSSYGVHAVSFNGNTGAVVDLSDSPYSPSYGYSYTVAADPSNSFIYSDDAETDLFGWKRDTNTGALTSIGEPTVPLAPSVSKSISAVTVTF